MTAIQHIERLARGRSEQAVAVIKNVQQMSNIPMHEMQLALKQLLNCGRIALHFHPDRIDSRGMTVAEGLLRDGQYRSQFETHISNGQLSPELGGPRDHWENQLLGMYTRALNLGLNTVHSIWGCGRTVPPHVLEAVIFDSYKCDGALNL